MEIDAHSPMVLKIFVRQHKARYHQVCHLQAWTWWECQECPLFQDWVVSSVECQLWDYKTPKRWCGKVCTSSNQWWTLAVWWVWDTQEWWEQIHQMVCKLCNNQARCMAWNLSSKCLIPIVNHMLKPLCISNNSNFQREYWLISKSKDQMASWLTKSN